MKLRSRLLETVIDWVLPVLSRVFGGLFNSFAPAERATMEAVLDRPVARSVFPPDSILPQFVLTFELEGKLSPEEKSRLVTAVSQEFARLFEMWFPVTDVFTELVGGTDHPYVFEVTVTDGSFDLRIVFVPLLVAVTLCSYGCGNPRLTRLGDDMRRVVPEAVEQVTTVIEDTFAVPAEDAPDDQDESEPERKIEWSSTTYDYGTIIDLDDTLDQLERGETTEDECIDALVHKLEQIRKSNDWELLVRPLVRYINTRYGELFDWEKLQPKLPELGPEPEKNDVDLINVVTIRVELPSNCTEVEVKRCGDAVREAVGAHVDDGEESVVIVIETGKDGDSLDVKIMVVIAALLAGISQYGPFRQGLNLLMRDMEGLRKRILKKLADHHFEGRINLGNINVDDRALLRLRRFLANAGEASASREELDADANQLALEIEDRGERVAFERFASEYFFKKYPDTGTT